MQSHKGLSDQNAERGDANIIMIVLLVIIVIGIFVGFQILPLRWDHAHSANKSKRS